jgi:8-oxo-dGTP pyrophosphatase MutT (NUDIX family)
MFVTDELIRRMEVQYGVPARNRVDIPCTPRELDRIKGSQKEGRNHDVTLYIRKERQWIVMAKHVYPPGLFRAPSGGLHPGESFEDGVARELAEETGCEATLQRFLLRSDVYFHAGDRELYWRSFVFVGDYRSGNFQYTDHHEIREIRLAEWAEFAEWGRVMRTLDMGGLHYRAALHERVASLLDLP